jgi:hypothetical protein
MCQKRSSAAFGQRAAGEALARPHDAKELGLKFRIICCQRSAVKKAAEYEKHVEECLELARSAATDEHRRMLWKMAETWKALAEERRRQQSERSDKTTN